MSDTSYYANPQVRSIHDILHLNNDLQESSNDFNVTIDSQWNDYTKSLLPIPIICAILGVLVVLSFQIALCCRIPFLSCKCLPSRFLPATQINGRYRFLLGMITAFFLASFVVLQGLPYGNSAIAHGLDTAQDSLDFVSDTFDSLDNYGNSLLDYGQNLEGYFNTAYSEGCEEAQNYDTYIDDYNSAVNDYLSYVSPVSDQSSDVSNDLSDYGDFVRVRVIWSLYAMVLVLIVFYVIGLVMKSKGFLMVGVGFSQCFSCYVFLFCGLMMALLMLCADFCMDPSNNTIMIVPGDIKDVTSFYLTCEGTNPLQDSLAEAGALIVTGDASVQYLLNTTCQGNSGLESAASEFKTIERTYFNVTTLAQCPPLQSELTDLLNSALCDDTFRGFFWSWLAQYLSILCIFIASIFTTILYNYYSILRDLEGTDEGVPVENVVGNFSSTRYSSYEEYGQSSHGRSSLGRGSQGSVLSNPSAPPIAEAEYVTDNPIVVVK